MFHSVCVVAYLKVSFSFFTWGEATYLRVVLTLRRRINRRTMPSSTGIRLAGGIVVVKDEQEKQDVEMSAEEEKTNHTHRGTNKSGRGWKTVRKEKASMAILKPLRKTLGSSWEKKQAEKQKVKEAKELQREILEKKKAKIEKEKVRNAANRKRKAENELKNAKVQVMSHPEKIKKMSKKQLRSVYKTRMGDDGVVRLVGAYE